MLPSHYFEVICCPTCQGDLKEQSDGGAAHLKCSSCAAQYPIADGIPILLVASDDEVSKKVSEFYATAWRRNAEGMLHAKKIHEDTSDLGQRYGAETAARFENSFRGRPGRRRFFLDAAAGAQPRTDLGESYAYHVCVDFSLDGLAECRRLLGDRAIVVCGSLLKLPIRTSAFDGIVASHCVYHIAKELQTTAIHELLRVLRPGGRLVMFYANPDAHSSPILARPEMAWLRLLIRRSIQKERAAAGNTKPSEPGLYTFLHPIELMKRELSAGGQAKVSVKPLRLFAHHQSQPVLQHPVLGKALFKLYMLMEKMYENQPEKSYFLTYTVDK